MLYLLLFISLIANENIIFGKPILKENDIFSLSLIKRYSYSSSIRKRSSISNVYPLYDQEQIEYLTKINIGTPPQEFLVSIDTGSADTWIPSISCPDKECPYKKFKTNNSRTLEWMNSSFVIQYGAGSITGNYAKDTIRLVNNNKLEDQQQIKSQIFGLADSAKDNIISLATQSNGILGLSFPALAANSDTKDAYDPILFALARQKLISEPVFSISLDQEQMMIGGKDKSLYKGDIHYMPVVKNINPKTNELDYTFWSIGLKNIVLNNHTDDLFINKSQNDDTLVILDTGTTLSYLNKELTDKIVRWVTQREKLSINPDTYLYTVDCKLRENKDKRKLVFLFSSINQAIVRFEVDIQDLISPPKNDNDSQDCIFGITYNYDEQNTFVFGDSILRSTYLIFDMDQKQVGLATNSKSRSFSNVNTPLFIS
ncbi:aspartic peptidase domain-containing protein [Cokeromyces recurvatus]|uniref:aspartic peptidase domain-containing protein n=1 Tax=Cokeromyces recurvatus TaxID=90255 RepID=UPI002220F321|nr:aspartic peptidase domain-containing protein [Cokeromyces recurvatus]KAI7907180.1 aspartic peptidase domain-containing protein [Cokeromyces recurvatus]